LKELTRKEEQVLLAIWHLRRDAYLITIREQVRKFTGTTYSVGTIFAPLDRLERNGFVTSYYQANRRFDSKKPIKFYKLTDRGLQALEELREIQAAMWREFRFAAEERP